MSSHIPEKDKNAEDYGYANHIGWTDVKPFEIIKRTAKTITIREMKAEELPWEKDVHVGGFAAHISNQRDQEWKITPDEDGLVLVAHRRKDGYFHSRLGKHSLSEFPHKFYDNNF